ncbi:hypothetical protein X801_02183 [Opisthorchis viverrini]|uniref:L-serine deaminase n=1 Tax=Opisthorchis viverrini TaxID=6198 RepID=A0A1S8X5B7_OPIVI|nr:hypothetical protein X801_02183 [Opisthorchis viverrini]
MDHVTENNCHSPYVFDCEEKQADCKHRLITDIPIPDANDPDVFEPDCDLHNPVAVTYRDVSAAYYRIRDGIIRTPCKEQAKRGVIASSAGNHGQALAYHGKNLNIPVTIVMPVFAPLMKVENCLSHGANVVLKGTDMSQVSFP